MSATLHGYLRKDLTKYNEIYRQKAPLCFSHGRQLEDGSNPRMCYVGGEVKLPDIHFIPFHFSKIYRVHFRASMIIWDLLAIPPICDKPPALKKHTCD